MSHDSRSEFGLLSDVTGLSSLVDLLSSVPGATPGSVLGPFHTAGSPWLPNPANLIGANLNGVDMHRAKMGANDLLDFDIETQHYRGIM